ncbi:hypothetical protein ACTFIR_003928 [Dictyostelium discoideum]
MRYGSQIYRFEFSLSLLELNCFFYTLFQYPPNNFSKSESPSSIHSDSWYTVQLECLHIFNYVVIENTLVIIIVIKIFINIPIWRSENLASDDSSTSSSSSSLQVPQVLGTFQDVLTKQSVESIPIQISTTLETGDFSTFQFHTPQRLENYVFMVKIKESHPTLLSLLDQF